MPPLRLAFLVREAADPPLGGDTYLARMAAALADAGHDVTVTSDATALPPDAIRVIDGAVLRQIDASLIDGAIGVIHHWPAADGAAALRPARLARVIVPGPATAHMLAERCAGISDRIAVVPPGLDALPRSRGSDDDGHVDILSVGVLTRRKGHETLLRALARLPDLDWTLTVAGGPLADSEEPARLGELTVSLGIAARVRWAGMLGTTALARAWCAADLFALASRWEGYGTAVAEALRRGLPVAVTEGGDNARLVGAECGVVCPVDDVEQLSKALRRLIFDEALRRRMAAAAWEAGARLPDWPTQAQAFASELG